MKSRVPVLVAFAVVHVVAAGVGCGVSPEDTRALWGSVQASVADAGGGASQQQALTVSVSLEVDCENGGEADVRVNLDLDDDSPLFDLTALFGYDIGYDDCAPDENTLNGELSYTASLIADETDSGGTLQIVTRYEGTITSTGETNATCEIDVDGAVDASAYERPGDEFHAGVHIEYDGTICGEDASELLDVQVDSET